ncbi:triokinase/FMN cyclase-like [Amphiura filiformis]|uniref:triokinase/FMN cyclase-like n=1 Tax=Amphiura filiformis TaxID=82378 RepID=UPI003B21CEB7
MTTAPKKLLNSIEQCVDDALEGVVSIHPGLRLLDDHRVVIREDIEQVIIDGKVTLLSGGGSGHEPAHAGFVGKGMLSGAIAGSVFASPPPHSILAAIRAVGKGNKAGTLLIVKNYTGDRLNFGIAAERAKSEGIRTEIVVVGEDCALTSSDKSAGRRGLCGTILIHKIAGSMSEEGRSLDDILLATRAAASDMGTIGICLYPCSVPGSGPSFTLGQDEIELGLGIHGEAGVKRMKLASSKDVVSAMISHMTASNNASHLAISPDDHVAVVVNNLGGTSYLELSVVAKDAIAYLESQGVSVERVYCGTFMTSLEMAGASITIMHLDKDGHRAKCLDAETTAPAWPRISLSESSGSAHNKLAPLASLEGDVVASTESTSQVKLPQDKFVQIKAAILAACDALITSEELLNELDRGCGDGDCGTTMKRGAQGVSSWLTQQTTPMPLDKLALKLSAFAEQNMGGSSGALYCLFFSAAAHAATAFETSTEHSHWATLLQHGIYAISKYGGAEVGDRTMLDSLHAAFTSLQETVGSDVKTACDKAIKAASEAAEKTQTMDAKAGRASYVSKDLLTKPDPGATAVVIWLKAALMKVAEQM